MSQLQSVISCVIIVSHWLTSVCRCQIMEYTGRCVTVSEPTSLNVLAVKYRRFGDSRELQQLARDVIRWECRPYQTLQPPPLGYFIKFTSVSTVALPLFRQVHTLSVVAFALWMHQIRAAEAAKLQQTNRTIIYICWESWESADGNYYYFLTLPYLSLSYGTRQPFLVFV